MSCNISNSVLPFHNETTSSLLKNGIQYCLCNLITWTLIKLFALTVNSLSLVKSLSLQEMS